MGISTTKSFISTKADLSNVSLSNYKIVDKWQFAYVADTSRRGDKIGLAFQDTSSCLVSSIYTTFRVEDESALDPYYLMMYFKRPEFDRYARYHSWGSARETFTWEDMCNIQIPLLRIEVQREYVAVYKAMQHNLNAMQNKLDDLKLVCDAYIEQLRQQYPLHKIGKYITEVDERNNIGLCANSVKGLTITKELIDTKADMKNVSLNGYKVICNKQFVYSPVTSRNGDKISIALNTDDKQLVSSVNTTFCVVNEGLLNPFYLMMYFNRPEFDRYARYHSWGSARETFTWEDMCDVEIPIPPIEVQKSIVAIYDVYNRRKQYAERLRQMINEMCPILVAASVGDTAVAAAHS